MHGSSRDRTFTTSQLVPLGSIRKQDANAPAHHKGTETRKICFATGIDGETEIPRGIELLEVDPGIRKDGERGALFVQLGVQEFSPEAACEAIVRAHRDPSFDEAGLSPADLAFHALFLYRSGHYGRRESRLWFVAQDGTRGRGHEFYIRSARGFVASSWPREFQRSIRFLHEEYLSGFLEDPASAEAWADWLASFHGVRIFPTLVSHSSTEGPSLSEDFLSLLRCYGSGKVLELLKHQWHYYAEQLNCPNRGRGELNQPDKRVVTELGSIRVPCRGGKVVPLDQTILPSSNIPPALSSELNILDIPNPDDPQWWFLSMLVVSSKLEAPGLTRQIRVLRDSGQSMEFVETIYRELQWLQHSDRDKELLRGSFATDLLIFIPGFGRTKGAWLKTDGCVWDGHQSLHRTARLRKHYPELRHPFQNILQIGDASLVTMLAEARSIAANQDVHLQTIQDTFIAFSAMIHDNPGGLDATILRELASLRIFSIKGRCDWGAEKIADVLSVHMPDGSTAKFQADAGFTCVKEAHGELCAYLTKATLSSSQAPIKLVEQFAEICGIEGQRGILLLQQILSRDDVPSLAREFQSKGSSQKSSILVPMWMESNLTNTLTAGQAVHLLSMAAKAKNRDEVHLLPLKFTAKARQIGMHRPYEELSWLHRSCKAPGLDWKKAFPSSDLAFQALFLPQHDSVLISSKNVNNVTEDVAFLGELAVSMFLKFRLVNSYDPERCWTSPLRIKAGLPPCKSLQRWSSTFTIVDRDGAFAGLLSRLGHDNNFAFSRHTYHIEVVTTEEALERNEFFLGAEQFKKAQRLSRARNPELLEALILIRVFNVHKDPRLAIFVDPWSMIADGSLTVLHGAHYSVAFAGKVPPHISSFDFCSWIPYWTQAEYPRTISTWDTPSGGFRASGNTKLDAYVHRRDNTILVARGALIDRIKGVGSVTHNSTDAVEYINSLHADVDSLPTPYPTSESADEIKRRLPVGNASRPHLDPRAGAITAHQALAGPMGDGGEFSLLRRVARAATAGEPVSNFERASAKASTKSHTATAFSVRLSVAKSCVTELGYIGLVPHDAEVGDTVIILDGAAVPFIMRKRDKKAEDTLPNILMGECYLHRIMYGEALEFDEVETELIQLA
ncbi:hypothetical protein B0H63DRAFT_546897 [Podospora didyma]|uniref:Heterokaryon incompatibility domain-containing protein n=1 Tax=Podospora didyma TaxID=330526 RepID=A0AAE0KJK0_9PEZI|nr:hypothetical protein B0H63DRAFT_546897 [Podospora didyma]